jgi:hypothetical protein
MSKAILPTMVVVIGFTILLSSFAVTSSFAETETHSEEYMQQHDGGDRAEYLEEMEHSDPLFYVPPVSDASISTTNNNATS